MAYRVGAGEAFRSIEPTRPLPNRGHPRYVLHHDDYSEYDSDDTSPHPRPLPVWDVPGQRHDRARGWHGGEKPEEREWSPEPEHHQFFIIREGTPSPVPTAAPSPGRDVIRLQPNHHHQFHSSQQQHHHHRRHHHDGQQHANNNTHEPAPAAPVACSMERTASGRTILTEATTANQDQLECADFSPEEDRLAALQVRRHMAKPRQNAKRHERILRALIHPKPHAAKGTEFPLDNDALESIFSAADEIFFQGRLARRVHWEWSSFEPSSTGGGGGGGIIGTTALRRASPPARGGYETLIVLSSPILTDTGYNRRLLIATFLHELVHSYLFICCGFKARHCGGHTAGFRAIAAAIDEWAGRGTLRLCDMEADLAHFREAAGQQQGESSPPPTPLAAAAAHDGESSGRGQGQMSHDPLHEQQQQQHYQYQPYRYEPQHEKRYHHHGGVEFYDLNESPWSTGPRVVFGSGSSSSDDSGRRHHYHHQQGMPAASQFTTLDSSPSSTTTPQGAGCAWSYHQTRFSSPPTPPPSMSTTPLSSVTTLVGREEDDMVVMYDEYCCEHHEGGQQQQHVFTAGSNMKYF